MDALKPCPFCGGIKLKFNKCASVIYCESCGARNPRISKFLKDDVTEEEATVLSWNTRVDIKEDQLND
jgi:Lar family restriction alleviation protein